MAGPVGEQVGRTRNGGHGGHQQTDAIIFVTMSLRSIVSMSRMAPGHVDEVNERQNISMSVPYLSGGLDSHGLLNVLRPSHLSVYVRLARSHWLSVYESPTGRRLHQLALLAAGVTPGSSQAARSTGSEAFCQAHSHRTSLSQSCSPSTFLLP